MRKRKSSFCTGVKTDREVRANLLSMKRVASNGTAQDSNMQDFASTTETNIDWDSIRQNPAMYGFSSSEELGGLQGNKRDHVYTYKNVQSPTRDAKGQRFKFVKPIQTVPARHPKKPNGPGSWDETDFPSLEDTKGILFSSKNKMTRDCDTVSSKGEVSKDSDTMPFDWETAFYLYVDQEVPKKSNKYKP